MKIALYNVTTASKIGGIETYYWETAKELRRRGYKVEIICGTGDHIKYPEIPIRQFPYTPRQNIPDLGNRFQKWGERLSFFKSVWPYMKGQHYDVVLIHKPLDFFVAWFMKRYQPKIRTVFISGGEDFYGFDRYFSRYIDHMFAVSQSNAALIAKRYRRKVPVIPNGVDVETFRPRPKSREVMRERFGLEDHPTLISVGRIVGWKGFQLVIEALPSLPDYRYLLIGEGDYLEKLKQLAEDKDVSDRILFLGPIENHQLPDYLSAADIFVQPSIGHEAFGITLLEAMACGLPVVASTNGGMKEIVVEGTNGSLFPIGDIDRMARKIKQTFKKHPDPRPFVLQNYTWKMSVEKLLQNLGMAKP